MSARSIGAPRRPARRSRTRSTRPTSRSGGWTGGNTQDDPFDDDDPEDGPPPGWTATQLNRRPGPRDEPDRQGCDLAEAPDLWRVRPEDPPSEVREDSAAGVKEPFDITEFPHNAPGRSSRELLPTR